jgi:hypothetical protein
MCLLVERFCFSLAIFIKSQLTQLLFRYHLQSFIDVTEEDIPVLAEMEWTEIKKFERTLSSRQQSTKKTLVVPHLIGSPGFECLRLKVINAKEYDNLNNDRAPEIERVESECKEIVFFFGYEQEDLAYEPGILYSYWAKDPHVTKRQVNYAFAKASLSAFGLGYDSRNGVPSQGLNSYSKDDGRGSMRPFPSPLATS